MAGDTSRSLPSCEHLSILFRLSETDVRSQLPCFHGLLHLLDSPMGASPDLLQMAAQAAPQVAQYVVLVKSLHLPLTVVTVPTPFASFAFHPLDGFLQSTPYHVFPFLFPLHDKLHICLFVFVQMWSILASLSSSCASSTKVM